METNFFQGNPPLLKVCTYPQTERNNHNFSKGFPQWAFLSGFFDQRGISSTNWKEQPEFCKRFPHWDIIFIYLFSLVKVVSVTWTERNNQNFARGSPTGLSFFFGFFGQSGISSTNWKEQPEFCKEVPHWDLPLFFWFLWATGSDYL